MRIQSGSQQFTKYIKTATLMSVLLFSLGSNGSCPPPGKEHHHVLSLAAYFWFGEGTKASMGNTATFELGVALTQGAESSAAMLSWTPPDGAASFEFPGLQPENPEDSAILAYQAPVVMSADDTAHIAILYHSMPWGGDDLSQAVADLELEYDPARQSFLENALPRQDRTRWAALRPKTDAISIEDRFPVAVGNWELYSTGVLGFQGMPDSCANCVLEVYFCHEGAEEPAILDLSAGKRLISYQGEGITCFGPVPQRLTETGPGIEVNPPFVLEISPIAKVDPATREQFSLHVSSIGENTVSVNFDLQSSSGLSWKLYYGDWENPDLNHPVNSSL